MFVSNVQRNWIKTNTNALDGCFGVKERRGLPRRHEGPKFISALFVSRKDTKAQKKGGVPRRHEGPKFISALFVSRKDTKAQKKGGVPLRFCVKSQDKIYIFYLYV
jgi:hypothetical protein